ncbi:MAG: chemotaxis protein CheR [Magnetococcales bacterium]|nr:chemotaxis protein CheR [Magnetococcales bacterium]
MGGAEYQILSDRDFRRLSEHIYSQCGIMMPPSKKPLLVERLQKRIRSLGLADYSSYIDYVISPRTGGNELVQLIDVVTVSKTEFFRNPSQFEYMAQRALPELIKTEGAGVSRPLMIWSAGCSTGEEPYTLSIVLKEFSKHYPGIKFKTKILATDISSRVLEKGKSAVYEMERVAPIPIELKKNYLLRSKDRNKKQVRMIPEVRDMVRFRRLNFMDQDYGLREKMDLVFCRDVMIYFDDATKERVVNRFARLMTPGGYLFIGKSESLEHLNVPIIQVAPTIYRLPK